MSADICRKGLAEDLEIGDELDLDGDEYGDNENAIFGYATVKGMLWWHNYDTESPWVTVNTTQGEFDMPAGHTVKIKIEE
jgi:hypothetical protein